MRTELAGIRPWRHDLTGCLHVAMATMLAYHGLDPLEVLGARWGFHHVPGRLRREEYFFPSSHDDLLAALAPYHPVSSRWHEPPDATTGWDQVRAHVAAGQPAAVAVDNFHLPFRPAHQDVHSNHLITVYGFDDVREEVLVSDAVPPRFEGAIPIATLTAARGSANPIRHDRDRFFTANPINHRWLEITVAGVATTVDREFVTTVAEANAAAWREPPVASDGYVGMAGLGRFLQDRAERLAAGRAEALDEVFIVAGPTLAVTALHAEWWALLARRFDEPRLDEVARSVDRLAHHWTAIRILVGSARTDPAAAAPQLRARGQQLVAGLGRVLHLIDDTIRRVL